MRHQTNTVWTSLARELEKRRSQVAEPRITDDFQGLHFGLKVQLVQNVEV